MIRICSACKLVLGTTDDGRDDEVTHGLCQDCAERLYVQLFPVGARVMRDGKQGEVVKHLQTRVMVLWDDSRELDAAVVAPSTLHMEDACT